MSEDKLLPRRLQNALVTVGCFIEGVPMPPEIVRPLIATLALTKYPLLAGNNQRTGSSEVTDEK